MSLRAQLYVRDPITEDETFMTIIGREACIGKSRYADVRLKDLRCAGVHALIEYNEKAEKMVLVDLGSRFGTQVNGEKIHETSLESGDVIQIGNHHLVIREAEENSVFPPGFSEEFTATGTTRVPTQEDEEIHLVTENNLLQVALFWGDQQLDVRTFLPGAQIDIGSQKDSTFPVTLTHPKLQSSLFRVAEYSDGKLRLNLPLEATGLVWLGNETYAIDALRHRDATSHDFGDLVIDLRVGDRAEIHFGELTLSFRFTHPPKAPPVVEMGRLDRGLMKVLGGVFGLYLLLFLWVTLGTEYKEEKTLKDIPKHLKKVLFDRGIEAAMKRQQSALGELAANLKGGRARSDEGKASSNKKPKPKAQKKKTQKPKTETKQKQRKTKVATSKPKTKVAPVPKIDLDSAFVSSTNTKKPTKVAVVGKSSNGNTAAALANGNFARGNKGLGSGGGGKSVGIGELKGYDTGGGMGSGDYGLNPSKGREIEVQDTEEIVILGGLDPDIINAVIRRYLPQIQHCYEQQLALNSKLKGKVRVSFVISGDGSVKKAQVVESSLRNLPTENCIAKKILGWKFPKPRGGGTVGVKYPFLLMSSSGQ